jgi:hypothetical protein
MPPLSYARAHARAYAPAILRYVRCFFFSAAGNSTLFRISR